MNQTRYYVRVGIALAVGLALLALSVAYLRGTLTDLRTLGFDAEFADAQGVTAGADVQMAGVRIGRVESVEVTPENTALLRLRVGKERPIPSGSRFVISRSLLGGASSVRVVPPPAGSDAARSAPIAEDQVVQGESSPGLEEAFSQAQPILASLRRTVTAVEQMATNRQTQRDLRETLRNVRVATEDLPRLSRRVERELTLLSGQTRVLIANLETASESGVRIARNAEGLSGDVRGVLAENRATLRSLVTNLDETTSAVAGITEQVNDTLRETNLKENLAATTANLRTVTQRLDTAAGNIERLTSDPRLSADIRQTVSNIRETSESVRALGARIEAIRLPGERRRPGGGGDTPGPPRPRPAETLEEEGPRVDTLFDTKRERLRVDANFTLLREKGAFYRAGLYDLSEANRLNLQVGQTSGDTALRYGLVNGRFGAGLDLRTGPLFLRFDLYDPNRLTLDARARARISETTSALFGIESLGSGNRAVLGVQIRR